MSVADKKGLKRVCNDCGTRFYDMNKRPVICPNCSTEFKGAEIARVQQTTASSKSKAKGQVDKKTAVDEDEDDDLNEDEEDDLEVIDLDNDLNHPIWMMTMKMMMTQSALNLWKRMMVWMIWMLMIHRL